jgi:DNA-binding response OmpR family regulator
MPNTILFIDDDTDLLSLLKTGLERYDFEIIIASSGEEGLRKAYATHPDAIILDVMMPKVDGWMVCQRLRQVCDKPIVMLTAKSDARDVVRGLSLGADEYIVKPCSPAELNARLQKVLQRAPQNTSHEEGPIIYDHGQLCIDLRKRKVTQQDEQVDLTPTEFRLLRYLITHKGRIVSHKELLLNVWGPQYANSVKYLSVYIRYLREKIEVDPSNPQHILTKHRVGYCFAD